jgi:hypothetical protein
LTECQILSPDVIVLTADQMTFLILKKVLQTLLDC